MTVFRYCVDAGETEDTFLNIEVCRATKECPDRDTLESCDEDDPKWWGEPRCFEMKIKKFEAFLKEARIEVPIMKLENKTGTRTRRVFEGITFLQFHAKKPRGTDQKVLKSSVDCLDFRSQARRACEKLYSRLLGGRL